MPQLNKRSFFIVPVLVLLMVGTGVLVWAQDNTPTRTHRLIRTVFNDSATNMRWIEMWETVDPTTASRELVALQVNGSSNGVQNSCSYLRIEPNEVPVYVVDGVRQQVINADDTWNRIANRNIFDGYKTFAAALTCDSSSSDQVNGTDANKCSLSDVNASNLFLLRPPATAKVERWTTPDNSQMVKYNLTADGSDSHVYSEYDVLAGGTVTHSASLELMCFDQPFPVAEGLSLLSYGNQMSALFDTIEPLPGIQKFYADELGGKGKAWTPAENQPDPNRQSFTRTLDSGALCQVDLIYTPASGATAATMKVDVLPDYILKQRQFAAENPATGASVASSATDAQISEAGSVADAVSKYLPTYLAEGWQPVPALTDDQREDSAFITLQRDNYQMHLIVEGAVGRSFVRIQTRSVACGPTFSPEG